MTIRTGIDDIEALTFDTGGTILDWHTGICSTLKEIGSLRGVDADWAKVANDFRKRSLEGMVNHGEKEVATKNFDDVHRETMDIIADVHGLESFTAEDRRRVWWDTMHNLRCWQDFPRHNFDLDAAKARGFKTAFVRRPLEWGANSPPGPEPSAHHDFVVDSFEELGAVLGVTMDSE